MPPAPTIVTRPCCAISSLSAARSSSRPISGVSALGTLVFSLAGSRADGAVSSGGDGACGGAAAGAAPATGTLAASGSAMKR
jgi:hypothetical protein